MAYNIKHYFLLNINIEDIMKKDAKNFFQIKIRIHCRKSQESRDGKALARSGSVKESRLCHSLEGREELWSLGLDGNCGGTRVQPPLQPVREAPVQLPETLPTCPRSEPPGMSRLLRASSAVP